ncbi:MAG: hypothetical protein AB7E95_04210, partial [Kiritimatiellales bacterium]
MEGIDHLRALIADCAKVARDPDVSAQTRNSVLKSAEGWSKALDSGALSQTDLYNLIEAVHGEISMMRDKNQRFDSRYPQIVRRLDEAKQFVLDGKDEFVRRNGVVELNIELDLNNPYEIISISDASSFGLVEEMSHPHRMWISKGVNPLGAEAVFKCKDTTVNEVFGYVLAAKMGMPVPDFKGIWFFNEFVHPDKTIWPSGTMGLLVKKVVSSHEIYLSGAVQKNAKFAAQNLLLWLFLGGG